MDILTQVQNALDSLTNSEYEVLAREWPLETSAFETCGENQLDVNTLPDFLEAINAAAASV